MIGNLLCGLILGWLAAGASFWMGFSVASMLGIYVLGGNLGIALSVLWTLGRRASSEWLSRWPMMNDPAQ